MQIVQKPYRWIVFFSLLILVLSGCTRESNTEDPDVYTPECTVEDLITKINEANADGVPSEIQLPANCVYTLTEVDNTVLWQGLSIHSGLPAIISEITIRGNNSVIEIQPDPGEGFFGHFFLDVEKKLKLYDLTLKDGARYLGGAVVSNHGDLLAYNVKFLNNMAYPESMDNAGKGGAIYSYFGKVKVKANSLFQRNLAGQTLTSSYNLGGAIYTFNSSLSINSAYFLENFSAGHGGAVYAEKTAAGLGGGLISIHNSEFSQNTALVDGGGLYLKGSSEGAFIASSTFTENFSEGQGGALFIEDSAVNINFTDFFWNDADHGGAVYTRRSAAGETSQLLIEHSVISNNEAVGNGGAIFSENSDLELEDGLVSHNLADSCGAIQLGGHAGVVAAEGDLGTAQMIDSSSKIISSSISHNDAISGYGGGVCHLMGELDISETDFINNYTPTYGGALISMDQLNIFDSTFELNQANRGAGLVIGFPLDDNNYVSPTFLNLQAIIVQSSISDNTALDAGGGIWAHHGGTISINKSIIADNMASEEGGGIYLEEGNLYIYNSTLAQNDASQGGGLYSIGENSELTLNHTTVAYNNARVTGGGLYTKGPLTLRQALVVSNTNNDCYRVQGLVTGGTEWFPDTYVIKITYGVDSDGTCSPLVTVDNPQIGGFNGTYVPILDESPLIDIEDGANPLSTNVNCYSAEDQIGTSRAQGQYCEPGSIEYDPNAPPPSPPPAPGPAPLPEPSDESGNCDPFAGLEISVHQLGINPETMVMPVYLRFPAAAPGIGPDGSVPYLGTLGGVVSHLVN